MTEAGYRLTRFADDFVVICNTRQEAEAALALAKTFLQEKLGVSLHPEKTRIVHVRDGFEFLGYKIRRGKGLRMAAHKRTTKANPLDLYAIPRARSVDRFKDQIRNLTKRTREAGRSDRGYQPDHPRLGETTTGRRMSASSFISWTGGSNVGCGRSSPSDGGTPLTASILPDGW